jgi:hypothetical protein
MRKTAILGAAAAALLGGASAAAQSSFTADVLGSTIANMSSGTPRACYDGRMQPKPKTVAQGAIRVASAIQNYLQIASASTDLKPLFTGSSKSIWHWDLDGKEQDVRNVRDPWAGRVTHIEPIGVVVSNQGYTLRALWRATAKDGTVLGTYDAWLYEKGGSSARFLTMRLYSVDAPKHADALVPFCFQPGDIETWREAKAKREAGKAAKRAAAARSPQGN